MPKYASLFVVLIWSLLSCSDQKKPSIENTSSGLRKSESLIRLPLDSVTANVSDFLTYYDDGKNDTGYLFSINTFTNQVQIFDLDQERMLQTITVAINGERGAGPLRAVYVKDFENILLFSNNANQISVIDTTGVKFQKISYEPSPGYSNALVSSSFFSGSPWLQNNRLYAKTLYQTNYRSISNSELSKKHTAYSIDLNSGETTMLPHFFPNDYFEEGMKHFDFSAVHSAKGAVYSFFGDHNLYFTAQIEAPLQKMPAASKYLKSKLDVFPADGDAAARGKYMSASDHYGSLLYDAYRNVYYRFCYPALEIEDMPALRSNIQFPTSFSIMILDEDLNILDETLFDKNTELVPKNAFVGKKGLYLSVNHPESNINQEDQLSFRLITLVKPDAN